MMIKTVRENVRNQQNNFQLQSLFGLHFMPELNFTAGQTFQEFQKNRTKQLNPHRPEYC